MGAVNLLRQLIQAGGAPAGTCQLVGRSDRELVGQLGPVERCLCAVAGCLCAVAGRLFAVCRGAGAALGSRSAIGGRCPTRLG
jgi:hypothetical protein